MFLKGYKLENLKNDIPAGIVVALVSIPISMGYAQVSGLPAVYGLYGSMLPILLYGFITTSPRFVFGVDAAPAALVGGMLAAMGIAAESGEAIRIVPVITLITAAWLFLFYVFKAGRVTKYISKPVLGGFVSGICCEIILMQIPKIFGGSSATGELPALLKSLFSQARDHFSGLSLALGLATIAIILVLGRILPKIPMSVVMMGVGALMTVIFHVEDHGVKLLAAVDPGLPHFAIPDVQILSGHFNQVIVSSISVAAVIVAETLLSTNNYAQRYGDKINNNREILAYAAGNLVSALSGCCPVNGSVSRTGIADGLKVKSQMMSVVAAVTMLLILLFATGFIAYLPVPVLTAIVIAALINSTEFHIAKQLRKVDRTEYIIFWIVFFTVLIMGTIYGVIIGVVLSFFTVVVRASAPKTDLLGCIPGRRGFFTLSRIRQARPLRGVVIYRFTGQLFFANIDKFQNDINEALEADTRTVIVDARAVSSIDITATERLMIINENLKKRGIRFFMTEHTGAINDLLRAYEAWSLFDDGCLVPNIRLALAVCGIYEPYDHMLEIVPLLPQGRDRSDSPASEKLDSGQENTSVSDSANKNAIVALNVSSTSLVSDYEWLYGDEADARMRGYVRTFVEHLMNGGEFSKAELEKVDREVFGNAWTGTDEEGLLDILEFQLAEMVQEKELTGDQVLGIAEKIASYHARIDAELGSRDKDLFRQIIARRVRREMEFARRAPEKYDVFASERKKHQEQLEKDKPELMKWVREIRKDVRSSCEIENPDDTEVKDIE